MKPVLKPARKQGVLKRAARTFKPPRKQDVLSRSVRGLASRGSKTLRRLRPLLAWVALGIVASTFLVTALFRSVPPPTSSFMIQRRLSALLEGKKDLRIRYDWVDWKRISPNAAIAVVAAEDQRFPGHFGFDLDSIADAMKNNSRRKRPRGASTITQQVAKNLFLWPGKSFLRKGCEAYFAVLIEAMWPKQRILEVYLNVAEFGPGIFGIKAASEAFFRKPPHRLRLDEAALLAAVLPNPHRLRADNPSEYVRRRASRIQRQALILGGPAYLGDL